MDESLSQLSAEGFHLVEDGGGFGFEGFALEEIVGFGVFAGFEFEVQVAEVFVDDIFALGEVVEAGLFDGGREARLWPEDVREDGDQEQGTGEDGKCRHFGFVTFAAGSADGRAAAASECSVIPVAGGVRE